MEENLESLSDAKAKLDKDVIDIDKEPLAYSTLEKG